MTADADPRPAAAARRAGTGPLPRVALHGAVLLVFAYAFARGTAVRAAAAGDPARLGPWLAGAVAAFVVAAALHAFLARSVLAGPRWLRNVTAVLLGGVVFGTVALVAGLWSWPDAPTRVTGIGVVYGLFTTFSPPLRPASSSGADRAPE